MVLETFFIHIEFSNSNGDINFGTLFFLYLEKFFLYLENTLLDVEHFSMEILGL